MIRPYLNRFRIGVVAILLSVLSTPAGAVVSPAGVPDYQIGVEDVLQISIRPRGDLNTQVTVLADGSINVPSLGAVKALGSTPNQLSQELTRRFGLFDRDITQVTVTVLAYNSRRVFLLGEVVKPGRYSFAVIPGIWDVIRESGGPTNAADLSSVQIIRGEGDTRETMTADLGAAIASGDFSGLPQLKPGDTIRLTPKQALVPSKDQVYVMGDVKAPGVYSTQSALDVVSAVMSAGGPGLDADMSEVAITRRTGASTRTVTVDLADYLSGGDATANLALKPGDTISIPPKQTGLSRGLGGLNTVLPVIQAIISSVIAIESVRIARGN